MNVIYQLQSVRIRMILEEGGGSAIGHPLTYEAEWEHV
jgi:hypothetical protein